jgi:hypothetical protein
MKRDDEEVSQKDICQYSRLSQIFPKARRSLWPSFHVASVEEVRWASPRYPCTSRLVCLSFSVSLTGKNFL